VHLITSTSAQNISKPVHNGDHNKNKKETKTKEMPIVIVALIKYDQFIWVKVSKEHLVHFLKEEGNYFYSTAPYFY